MSKLLFLYNFINSHEIESPLKKVDISEKHHEFKAEEEDKKKKRTQKKSALTNDIDDDDETAVAARPMSEGYMGGRVFEEENCPLIDAIEKRCRGIDLLSGDSHHNLLEACGAHQLCYLCVSHTECTR